MPAPYHLNRHASQYRRVASADFALRFYRLTPDRKTTRSSVINYTSSGVPAELKKRKYPISWAVGGFEWKRHLQFRHFTRQNRFYGKSRSVGKLQAKYHSLFDRKPKTGPTQRLGGKTRNRTRQKVNQETAVRLPAEEKLHEGLQYSCLFNLCRIWKMPQWKRIKRLLRKLRAKARRICPVRSEVVLNYDARSYEKNFDNGNWYGNPSFEDLDSVRKLHSLHVNTAYYQTRDRLQHQLRAGW